LVEYFPLLTDNLAEKTEVEIMPIDDRLKLQEEAQKLIKMFPKK